MLDRIVLRRDSHAGSEGTASRTRGAGTPTAVAFPGPDGEAVGPSFTIEATPEDYTELVHRWSAGGADGDAMLVGLEATGHYWESRKAYLMPAG